MSNHSICRSRSVAEPPTVRSPLERRLGAVLFRLSAQDAVDAAAGKSALTAWASRLLSRAAVQNALAALFCQDNDASGCLGEHERAPCRISAARSPTTIRCFPSGAHHVPKRPGLWACRGPACTAASARDQQCPSGALHYRRHQPAAAAHESWNCSTASHAARCSSAATGRSSATEPMASERPIFPTRASTRQGGGRPGLSATTLSTGRASRTRCRHRPTGPRTAFRGDGARLRLDRATGILNGAGGTTAISTMYRLCIDRPPGWPTPSPPGAFPARCPGAMQTGPDEHRLADPRPAHWLPEDRPGPRGCAPP